MTAVELDSHCDVSVPGVRYNTNETSSDMRKELVGSYGVLIAVTIEILQTKDKLIVLQIG